MIVCLCGCAYTGALQTWNPSRAASDPERDIAARNIRFAYIGGRASYPPGLPDDSGKIVRRYPILEVGDQGCEQDSGLDIREEYASRYNKRMWQYVSTVRRKSI
jgi:hypothetical protein